MSFFTFITRLFIRFGVRGYAINLYIVKSPAPIIPISNRRNRISEPTLMTCLNCSCFSQGLKVNSHGLDTSPFDLMGYIRLYTSDAADEEDSVDLGGRRI